MNYANPQLIDEASEDSVASISNLIFVDSSVGNASALVPDTANSEVIILNSQLDGVEQISQVLENYQGLDSIQIVSHGDTGFLQLGGSFLSQENLNGYQDELRAWGNVLTSDGDLLFYGCNVGRGEDGVAFVEQIASITGADVAASNDLTGNSEFAGDWVLEVAIGVVETQTFTLTEHNGVLALSRKDILSGTTADFNGDGKADLLRQEKGHWDDDNNNTAHVFLSTGNGFNQINLPESLNIKGDNTKLHLGDFNGDGKTDILRQEKAVADDDNINTASLLISHGNGFTNVALPENLWFNGDFNNLHIGDFNGDGKSDVFRQMKLAWDNNHNQWTGALFISTGNGFAVHTVPMGESHNLGGDNSKLYVGDFNGDGKSDLLRQEKGHWDDDDVNTAQILISNGTSFSPHHIPETFELKGDYTNLYVGDFNGDGRDDILRQEKSSWDDNSHNTANLLLSNGTSFSKHVLSESFNLKGDFTNLFVGDFNGDGRDDILRQEKNGWDNDYKDTAHLLLSTGNSFNKIVLSEHLRLGGDYINLNTGDFNGDGKTDLIRQEKGWYNYNDSFTAQLLTSTGNFFYISSISGASLNGNFANIITNNVVTNYLENNDTSGLKFKFTYDDGVNFRQKRAFEFAGQMWSELLRDNVTVNLHITMADSSELPGNTLGGAVPFFHQGTSYTQFKDKLSSDRDDQALDYSNHDDMTAINNLDSGSSFTVSTPSNDNTGILHNFDQVAVTRANAKALGIISNDHTALDGTIVMNNLANTGVSWQYDYFSNGVGSSKIDFTTVAMHEIGHILGFVSVVDGLNLDNYQDQTLLNESITSLDLFRFMGSSSFRSIRTGADAHFSIDGGVTNIARTAGGVANIGGDYNADGYQASHWKNEDDAGIMDPVLETNVRKQISELDLRALDVIGWDRKYAANSWGNLASEAWNEANDTGNINRNTDVNAMLQDWRWASRRSRGGTLRQEGNITQFLAQEGFFSTGVFRSSFDFSSVDSTNDSFIFQNSVVKVNSLAQELSASSESMLSEDQENSLATSEQQALFSYQNLTSAIDEWLDNQAEDVTSDNWDDLITQVELELTEPLA